MMEQTILDQVLERLHDLEVPARFRRGRPPVGWATGARVLLLGEPGFEVLAVEGDARAQAGQALPGELPVLRVETYVPKHKAERWIAEGRAFVDLAGNAYLRFPGITVRVLGNRPEGWKRTARQEGRHREWRGATLRLLFHLLCDPTLAERPIRELAKRTETGTRTVVQLFDELEWTGQLVRLDRRRRKLRPGEGLVDRWLDEYGRKLWPKLKLGRFRAADEGTLRGFLPTPYGALWGGENAAELLGTDLRAHVHTIYTHEPILPVLRAAGLVADPTGDITLRRIFWDPGLQAPRPDTTPTLLVVADLFALRDGRCAAAAAGLKREWIDDNA